MSAAITAHDVRKRYKLGGHGGPRYGTLRDVVANAASAPIRSIRGANGSRRARPSREFIWALQGVSFAVEEGEVVGIIGRNGAGKSTLLKILSRVTEPTSGRIELRGRVGSLLEVGTGFHAELTGRENVFLSGAVLGMTRADIRRRFEAIAEFSGVERFLDTPVKYYSSGMQARLGFAVAAHLEPDVLVVDEVLAVGDAEFQKLCLGKMGDVGREGRTVLFVSHNMTAINQLCPRTILLESGGVAADGATSLVVPEYLRAASEGRPERIWDGDGPGDQEIGLRSVRVLSGDRVSGMVNIDRETVIEVDFETRIDGVTRVAVDLYVSDQTGTVIFFTSSRPRASLTSADDYDTALPQGIYRHTCTIPANFLNDQIYNVTVYVSTFAPPQVHAFAPDAISFSVFDTGVMQEPGHNAPWQGMIRPRLPWERMRVCGDGTDAVS